LAGRVADKPSASSRSRYASSPANGTKLVLAVIDGPDLSFRKDIGGHPV